MSSLTRFCVAVALGCAACSATPGSSGGGTTKPTDAGTDGTASADTTTPETAEPDATDSDTGPTDTASPDSTTDAAADETTTPDSNVCTPGATKCDGTLLATCYPDGTKWQTTPCDIGTNCSNGACAKQVCQPGVASCVGQVIGTCNSQGTAIENGTDCAAAGKFCKDGQCGDQACDPGQPYCNGNNMAFCNKQGTGPDIELDCAQMGMSCVGTMCQPGPPQPCNGGPNGCDGDKAIDCTGATPKVVKDCGAMGQACDNGNCKAKICQPGQAQCAGDVSQFCNDSGTSWFDDQDCAQMGGWCDQGLCAMSPCNGAPVGCEGTKIITCNGKVVTVGSDCAANGQVCEQGKCVAKVCEPGISVCDGDNLKMCNASGSAFEFDMPCGIKGGICLNGQCIAAPCKPGEVGCDGNSVVSCNGPVPQVVQDCGATGLVCSKGACIAPVCAPNSAVCNGAKVMQCAPNGSGYFEADDCSQMGMTCLNGQCDNAPCAPGGKGCQDSDVVQCDANGGVSVVQACGDSGGSCSNGACVSPVCSLSFGKCEGIVASTCNEKTTGYDNATDCAKKGLVCGGGFCTSKQCPANKLGCQGKDAVQCSADGQTWQNKGCAASQTCADGACASPTCTLPAAIAGQALRMILWGPVPDGEGCDLNGDGKPDNNSKSNGLLIAGIFPQPGGTPAQVVAVAPGYKADGSAFEVQVLAGQAAAGQTCPEADAKASCKVAVYSASYDLPGKAGACNAKSVLAGAKVGGGKFVAGDPTSAMWLPTSPAPALQFMPIKAAKITGDVANGAAWSTLTKGRLCGAVAVSDLANLADKLNPVWMQAIGISAVELGQMVQQMVPDIDTNGDGKPDAVSFALRFVGAPVEVVGVLQ